MRFIFEMILMGVAAFMSMMASISVLHYDVWSAIGNYAAVLILLSIVFRFEAGKILSFFTGTSSIIMLYVIGRELGGYSNNISIAQTALIIILILSLCAFFYFKFEELAEQEDMESLKEIAREFTEDELIDLEVQMQREGKTKARDLFTKIHIAKYE